MDSRLNFHGHIYLVLKIVIQLFFFWEGDSNFFIKKSYLLLVMDVSNRWNSCGLKTREYGGMNNQLQTLLGLHNNTYFRVVFENLIVKTVFTFISRIFILLIKHLIFFQKCSTSKLNFQWSIVHCHTKESFETQIYCCSIKYTTTCHYLSEKNQTIKKTHFIDRTTFWKRIV